MNTTPRTIFCETSDIQRAVDEIWPRVARARGVDLGERGPAPHLDGHYGVGFSIRLFHAPMLGARQTDAENAAGYAALEDLLRGLEDRGFEVARDGNGIQEGRLVLGWAAFRRPYDTVLARYCDRRDFDAVVIERSELLARERAARDAEKTP